MSLNPATFFNFNKIIVQVDSLLATGGFSEVYLVKSESQTFILKRSSVPPDPSAYQNAVNEIDILVLIVLIIRICPEVILTLFNCMIIK